MGLQRIEAMSAGPAPGSRHFPEGVGIFEPGGSSDCVWLLERGLVSLQRVSADGDPVGLCLIRPGEVFGEESLFDRPFLCFAETLVPSVVSRVPVRSFRSLLRQSPQDGWALAEQLQARTSRLMDRVEGLAVRDVRTRLACMLLDLAEALGDTAPHVTDPRLPISQTTLANLIGTTRQSVNALLGRFDDDGLVVRSRGEVRLLRMDALRAVAAGLEERPAA